MSQTTLFILGSGAMGKLYAGYLKDEGPVHLIGRRDEPLRWTLEGPRGTRTLTVAQHSPAAVTAIQQLLVCVKAYQVSGALRSVREALSERAEVVLLHNGMGVWEEVQSLLPSQAVYYCSSTHGALWQPGLNSEDNLAGKLLHTGVGSTALAPLQQGQADSEFLRRCGQAFPPVQWCDDYRQLAWQKLAVNCVINPLATLDECRNGALADKKYRGRIEILCQELAAVMQASGLPADADSLQASTLSVIEATAANYCSTNRDIYFGRPTEIDYLNGYVVQQARYHGLQVPLNLELYLSVKDLEQQDSF